VEGQSSKKGPGLIKKIFSRASTPDKLAAKKVPANLKHSETPEKGTYQSP
jgi:hypothetical protein